MMIGEPLLIYVVIAALLLAAPLVIWLGLRLYVLIAASVRCRGCRSGMSDSERGGRCPISAGVLEEVEKAGRNMRIALILLLVLLLGCWLLSTTIDQVVIVNGIGIGALGCCVLYILTALTRLLASMVLPANMSCRTRVLESLKKNGRGFGWLMLVYILVHILLTI